MKLADFYIKDRLGAGAFGTAFLVIPKKDVTKRYVIKQQSNRRSGSFENEISVLMKLWHPNIIAFKYYWREDHSDVILMEYATHGTLQDYLDRRSRPLNEGDALYFLTQIVLGVNYIHRKQILHRDLKPANILLTGPRGSVVKIADFGISKDISSDLGRTIVGTEVYMAPEVLMGKTYGIKCDVWSIGVIFYQMITKKLPFNMKNRADMIQQICNASPYPLPYGLVSYECSSLSKRFLQHYSLRPSTAVILANPLVTQHVRRVYENVGKSAYTSVW